MKVAVIGAGLSGCVLALGLRELGHSVELFEKSRGPGGRLSTRRSGSDQFDHGAQFFTARSDEFRSFLQPFLSEGLLAEWSPRLTTLGAPRAFKRDWFEPHYVAVPTMNAWVKKLAANLDVVSGCKILSLEKQSQDWWLQAENGPSHGPYRMVCSTAPAPQSQALLPWLQSDLRRVRMQPCFAWMLSFPGRPPKVHWQAAVVVNSPIAWMCWGDSRPGRSARASLLIHSANAWAEQVLEESEATVQEMLAQALLQVGVDAQQAESSVLHRWRFASTQQDLGRDFLLDQELGLAACGDWCIEGRVEGAFLSARRLTAAIAN